MTPVTRRWLLLASIGAPLARALSPQPLRARVDGDYLHVSAPQLNFLTGKSLEHLKDGTLVGFLGQLTISTDANGTIEARSLARFALSYDVWEEKFSVTKIQQTRTSISHLSAEAAQAWCMDNLTINLAQIPTDRPFWIRLDFRAEDPRDNPGVVGEPGINLARLIELFSRPARAAQPRWVLDAGPLRLADLKTDRRFF